MQKSFSPFRTLSTIFRFAFMRVEKHDIHWDANAIYKIEIFSDSFCSFLICIEKISNFPKLQPKQRKVSFHVRKTSNEQTWFIFVRYFMAVGFTECAIFMAYLLCTIIMHWPCTFLFSPINFASLTAFGKLCERRTEKIWKAKNEKEEQIRRRLSSIQCTFLNHDWKYAIFQRLTTCRHQRNHILMSLLIFSLKQKLYLFCRYQAIECMSRCDFIAFSYTTKNRCQTEWNGWTRDCVITLQMWEEKKC